MLQQVVTAAVDGLLGHDVVTGLCQCFDGVGDGSGTGGGCQSSHAAFQSRDNPNIENSIFRSIHAVALDTMPGYKSEGVEHSFLERFNAMEAASDENE